jgi:hypothetical protein
MQPACWLPFALLWCSLSFKLLVKLIGAEQGYKPCEVEREGQKYMLWVCGEMRDIIK